MKRLRPNKLNYFGAVMVGLGCYTINPETPWWRMALAIVCFIFAIRAFVEGRDR